MNDEIERSFGGRTSYAQQQVDVPRGVDRHYVARVDVGAADFGEASE